MLSVKANSLWAVQLLSPTFLLRSDRIWVGILPDENMWFSFSILSVAEQGWHGPVSARRQMLVSPSHS